VPAAGLSLYGWRRGDPVGVGSRGGPHLIPVYPEGHGEHPIARGTCGATSSQGQHLELWDLCPLAPLSSPSPLACRRPWDQRESKVPIARGLCGCGRGPRREERISPWPAEPVGLARGSLEYRIPWPLLQLKVPNTPWPLRAAGCGPLCGVPSPEPAEPVGWQVPPINVVASGRGPCASGVPAAGEGCGAISI